MKSSGKILSNLLVIILILSSVITTAAGTEPGEVTASFIADEYDAVMELKQMPAALLAKSGYSAEAIDAFKNFSFEEALFERGQLSEDELYDLGYSEGQIALLKSYDGDSLENNPQMKKTFAHLTGSLTGENFSKNSIIANFSWEWSNAPLLNGRIITEVVACGLTAINDDSQECVVVIDNSFCNIEYYRGDSKIGDEYPSVSTSNPSGMPEVRFPMSKSFGNTVGWAKKGTMILGVKEAVTANKLFAVVFAFGYGHSVLTFHPSIRISGGSLTFGSGTDNMFFKTMILKYDGTYDIYNGNDGRGQYLSTAELFSIVGVLSLIAMIAAPFLLVSLIKKVQNKKTPTWECLLLAAGGFCLWFWLLIVFGSLPAM